MTFQNKLLLRTESAEEARSGEQSRARAGGARAAPSGYLDAVDVGLAHAATPVDEEDELPVRLPQVCLHRLEVRTEVEHDDRVVGNVFVKTFPDDFCLEEKGQL